MIKEVAPTADGVATDAFLGVGVFASQYFKGNPVYRDADKKFFAILGNRPFTLSLPSWNPFTLWSSFSALMARLKGKGIEGNYAGDYKLKGGLLVYSAAGELVLKLEEEQGVDLPYDVIVAAVQKLSA